MTVCIILTAVLSFKYVFSVIHFLIKVSSDFTQFEDVVCFLKNTLTHHAPGPVFPESLLCAQLGMGKNQMDKKNALFLLSSRSVHSTHFSSFALSNGHNCGRPGTLRLVQHKETKAQRG